MGPDEIAVLDAGFGIKELQEAKIERPQVRQAKNCAFRCGYLLSHKGRGRRPEYGACGAPWPAHTKAERIRNNHRSLPIYPRVFGGISAQRNRHDGPLAFEMDTTAQVVK